MFDDDDVENDVDVSLDTLFELAQSFNDGHNLKSIKTESAWHSSKSKSFEFGGEGDFISQHVNYCEGSSRTVQFGEDLNKSISIGDIDTASKVFITKVDRMLLSILDKDVRIAVARSMGQHFSILTNP